MAKFEVHILSSNNTSDQSADMSGYTALCRFHTKWLHSEHTKPFAYLSNISELVLKLNIETSVGDSTPTEVKRGTPPYRRKSPGTR